VHAAGGPFYKLTSKKRLRLRRPLSSSDPNNNNGLSAAADTDSSSGAAAATEASPPSDSPQAEVEASGNKASLSTKLREPSFLQLVLPWCAARWAARYPNLWHLVNRKLSLLEVQCTIARCLFSFGPHVEATRCWSHSNYISLVVHPTTQMFLPSFLAPLFILQSFLSTLFPLSSYACAAANCHLRLITTQRLILIMQHKEAQKEC